MRKHGFIMALLGVLVMAALFPELGARDGLLRAGLVSRIGVMVIFFLQGLTLKTGELAGGLKQLRLHTFVQSSIFVLAAMVLGMAGWLMGALSRPDLAAGFFYLALVPTTISSAVAFTSAAGGNVPASIFNVTLANVAGVFWVPAGCMLLFSAAGDLQPGLVLPLLWKVVQLILLPLIAGQILRPVVRKRAWFGRISPNFKLINHGIILFIVFAAISQSLLSDAWRGIGAGAVLLLAVAALVCVLAIHASVWTISGWLRLSRQDRICALFCGSQKTLAAGVPMAVAIFSGNSQLAQVDTGLLLLPLICFHPLQLFLAALLVPRLSLAS